MNNDRDIVFFFIIIYVLFLTCTPPEKMKVLIRMMESQENYFREEVISSFKTPEEAGIDILQYNNIDNIEAELKKYPAKISLVKVPFEKSWSLVRKGIILPLHSFLNVEELKEFNDTYLFTFLGRQHNQQYFIPRKYETRIMVYLKSKVREVAGVWKVHKESIHQDLKRFNGFGLPESYILENSPDLWDYYDIFVVGWIWAHTDYNGSMKPRIAHRGKHYTGTSHRLIDRVFQCGGDSAAVVSMRGDAVIDAFHWEAVYTAAGIYNPKMWEENWSGTEIWTGFAEGDVFLSFMTQLDCFFMHGTGRDGLEGHLVDPDDMGVATMPAGCSFALTDTGTVLRKGTKTITTGGWWWGIPKDSPDPRASYKLVRHITSRENQVQGSSRFGMIPVRKDVRKEIQTLFEKEWMRSIYDVSYRQIIYNKSTIVPSHSRFHEIANVYLDVWFDVVVGRNWSEKKDIPDRFYIKQIIDIKYIPWVDRIN